LEPDFDLENKEEDFGFHRKEEATARRLTDILL
jgi:hypothetical protein